MDDAAMAKKWGEHIAFSIRQHMDQYPEMNRAQSWGDLAEFTDPNEYIQWALWADGLNYKDSLNSPIFQAVKIAESLLFGSVSL